MFEKTTVLVVDDDPMLLSLLTDTLDSIGYDSVSEPDAESALERLSHNSIDIVVADINLPGIDGLELTRRVKKDRPEIPVILITGVSMKDIKSRAFKAGADGFLDKPFRITVIERLMEQLLMRRTTGGSTVLVIDDDEMSRTALKEQLQQIGYDASAASGGREALDMLQNKHFDILMTDLMMPEMDGIELSRRVKEVAPSTHVVIFTGSVPNDEEKSVIYTAADAFLPKPLQLEQVSLTLSSFENIK